MFYAYAVHTQECMYLSLYFSLFIYIYMIIKKKSIILV